jgi:hypothetical protein
MQLSDRVCQKHRPLVFLAGLLLVKEYATYVMNMVFSFKNKKETLCHQNLQKYTLFSQLNLKVYMKDLIVSTKFCKNNNFITLWEKGVHRVRPNIVKVF